MTEQSKNYFLKASALNFCVSFVVSLFFFLSSLDDNAGYVGNATPDKYIGELFVVLLFNAILALILGVLYLKKYFRTLKWLFVVSNAGVVLFLIAGGLASGGANTGAQMFPLVVALAGVDFALVKIHHFLVRSIPAQL